MTDRSRFNVASFSTGCIVLLTQILFFRIVSAKLTNNYAFLIISLTMLGFALSGIILTRRDISEKDQKKFIIRNASYFALSCLICTFILYHLPLKADDVNEFMKLPTRGLAAWGVVKNLLSYLPLAFLFSIPYIFSGLILGLLLTQPKLSSKEVYFMDLIGSSLGALLVLPLIKIMGVESLLTSSLIIYLGILALSFKQMPSKIDWLLYSLLLIPIFMFSWFFSMTYTEGSMLAVSKVEKVVWDPTARIEISKVDQRLFDNFNYPSLIGKNKKFHSNNRYLITQNNFAFTFAPFYDGSKNSIQGIEETIYSAGYMASTVTNPNVFIIGVGGGFDILTALYFDARRIVATEINAATIQIIKQDFRDYFKGWTEDPRLNLIVDDGRNFLQNQKETFDIIQLSGVDTYSGSSGAANVFAENYLYTEEALRLYFSRLNDDGILNIMRLEHGIKYQREMLRVLTTAVSSLRKRGIRNPKSHILMVTATEWNFTSLLIKKTPFKEKDLLRISSWANSSSLLKISASPFQDNPKTNMYQIFLNFNNPELEAQAISSYLFDISPVDDDRPFLFKFSFWEHLYFFPIIAQMEYNLIIQFLLSFIILLACVYIPLKKVTNQFQTKVSIWPFSLVAMCIGIGFMFYEIALMQKLSLFLGHPNYAISIVLSSLLLSAGFGSMWAKNILKIFKSMTNVSYMLCLLILSEIVFFFPALLDINEFHFMFKFSIAFASVLPIGLLLGTFMPFLIEKSKRINSNLSTWIWGINAIFSVLGPIMAIAISTTFGFNFLMTMAVPLYLLAGLTCKSIDKIN